MQPELVAATEALAVAGSVGPYFATEAWSADRGWRPMSEITRGRAAMAERVATATGTLARMSDSPPEELAPRVVASTVFLGLAARLVAPPLAAALCCGVLPRLTEEDLWWQATPGGPWPLAVDVHPQGWLVGDLTADPGDSIARQARRTTATLVAQTWRDGPVATLVDRVGEDFSVSATVLWGNVASAVAGATGMLGRARPDLAEAATALLAELLATDVLAGTGELGRHGAERRFVRRSCCLFYRVPGGGLCGDCVLAERG